MWRNGGLLQRVRAVYVCICNGITDQDIRRAAEAGCGSMSELTMRTGAGACCGTCVETASALLEGLAPGTYTVEVVGDYAASDPDTIDSDSVNGRVVFLSATQLRRR